MANQCVTQTGLQSDWVVVNTTPGNSDGNPVVAPLSLGSNVNPLTINGIGNSVQVCLQYKTASPPSNEATVIFQAFGIDGNGIPQELLNATSANQVTLTVATATDAQDANGNSYTLAATVGLTGNQQVLVCVKDALGSGTTGANLMARVI